MSSFKKPHSNQRICKNLYQYGTCSHGGKCTFTHGKPLKTWKQTLCKSVNCINHMICDNAHSQECIDYTAKYLHNSKEFNLDVLKKIYMLEENTHKNLNKPDQNIVVQTKQEHQYTDLNVQTNKEHQYTNLNVQTKQEHQYTDLNVQIIQNLQHYYNNILFAHTQLQQEYQYTDVNFEIIKTLQHYYNNIKILFQYTKQKYKYTDSNFQIIQTLQHKYTKLANQIIQNLEQRFYLKFLEI